MPYPKYLHDPDSNVDYEIDWSSWLPEGDTIVTAAWVIPVALSKTDEAHTDTTATVWISGGTTGANYTVTSRVTTAAGRIEDQSITLQCREL